MLRAIRLPPITILGRWMPRSILFVRLR